MKINRGGHVKAVSWIGRFFSQTECTEYRFLSEAQTRPDRFAKDADFKATSQSEREMVHFQLKCSRTPFIRKLVIRIGLVPPGKSVQNSTKLTCFEITGYWIKYSTVLWLLEHQICMVEKFRRRYIISCVA